MQLPGADQIATSEKPRLTREQLAGGINICRIFRVVLELIHPNMGLIAVISTDSKI